MTDRLGRKAIRYRVTFEQIGQDYDPRSIEVVARDNDELASKILRHVSGKLLKGKLHKGELIPGSRLAPGTELEIQISAKKGTDDPTGGFIWADVAYEGRFTIEVKEQ